MFSARSRQKCQQLFEKYYRGRKFHDSYYRELIAEHLLAGDRVLDAGCGRYLKFCYELSPDARVFGVDLDTQFDTDNARAPFAVRGDLHQLPFPAASFDLVISRSVVEHLDDPGRAFREWARVLRPGGKVIVCTPNKYDYVSLIAALTPYRFHRALVSHIFGVPEDDVFPTRYRANSVRSLRRQLEAAGFRQIEFETIGHYPAYLFFSPLLFRLGVAYERITSWRIFRSLRGSLLCAFEKRGAAASGQSAAEQPAELRA
jgi:SAM-dependent methyltransferase